MLPVWFCVRGMCVRMIRLFEQILENRISEIRQFVAQIQLEYGQK